MKITITKIFDNCIDVYENNFDSIRPCYPNKMYDDIKSNIHLSPDSTLLEIGSGNVNVIKKLAEYDCSIIGVEADENFETDLHKFSKLNQNISVIKTTFEQFQHSQSTIDVIIALTEFNRIEKKNKYRKVYELLVENGYFVLIWNNFLQNKSKLTTQLGKLYNKYLSDIYPDNNDDINEKVINKSERRMKEMFDHTKFLVCFSKRYFSLYHYDKTTYPKLLSTFPKISNIDSNRREEFLNEVSVTVARNGNIIVPIMTTLLIAQKKEMIINLVSSTFFNSFGEKEL
jgi:ubiquinone/menaquinone biosynthesis C-methylase UbiE